MHVFCVGSTKLCTYLLSFGYSSQQPLTQQRYEAGTSGINVTASQFTPVDTGKVSHFEGTPIPTSILIVALLAIMLWSGRAMISTVRIPKP